jgi:dTDP-glucose 4,6-dehydratase
MRSSYSGKRVLVTGHTGFKGGWLSLWLHELGARVFLTGGTGFFGVWLVAALAHARRRLGIDIALTVLSRDPEAARRRFGAILDAPTIELIRGDIRTFEFPSGTFTHVVHGATAASAFLNASQPREMFDVIVDGTRRALELATASGCTRFLLISSGAVYGPQPTSVTHVREDYAGGPSPLDARSAYAEGKRAAELLATMWASEHAGRAVVSARAFAFVAPYLPLDIHFAIGNFIRDALAAGPIRILGDGTPYRSYMYGTDLAVWLWTMLGRGQGGAAYNVGSEDGRPLRAIAERVALATGAELHVAREPTPERLASPERYVPDTSRAREQLGLSVRVNLDDAIRRTVAFHRA